MTTARNCPGNWRDRP